MSEEPEESQKVPLVKSEENRHVKDVRRTNAGVKMYNLEEIQEANKDRSESGPDAVGQF